MPWKETNPMDQRVRFVAQIASEDRSMTELCRVFGISRRTGYKWATRYRAEGIDGLKDRSRAPLRHPNAVMPEVERLIVDARHRHPRWGPRKLLAWLAGRHPEINFPATSTAGDLLLRHGLVNPRRRRRKSPPYSRPFVSCTRPNSVWCADFKGQFQTDLKWCYSLTVSDAYSRYLLLCRGLAQTRHDGVRSQFEKLFWEFGLPVAIRTDNGPPFGGTGLGGLTRLSAWWVKLGIFPERIEPGHPEQNGRHERMHRTLKQETASPPEDDLASQQEAFDSFVEEYNRERPHEALADRVPASVYKSSDRPYPSRLPEIEYASGYRVRRVKQNGQVKWGGRLIWISQILTGEPLGFWQVSEDCWDIYYGPLRLGVFNERNWLIERSLAGRTTRNGSKEVLPMCPV